VQALCCNISDKNIVAFTFLPKGYVRINIYIVKIVITVESTIFEERCKEINIYGYY